MCNGVALHGLPITLHWLVYGVINVCAVCRIRTGSFYLLACNSDNGHLSVTFSSVCDRHGQFLIGTYHSKIWRKMNTLAVKELPVVIKTNGTCGERSIWIQIIGRFTMKWNLTSIAEINRLLFNIDPPRSFDTILKHAKPDKTSVGGD